MRQRTRNILGWTATVLGVCLLCAMAFGILWVKMESPQKGGLRLAPEKELFRGARISTESLPGETAVRVGRASLVRDRVGFLVMGGKQRLLLEDVSIVVAPKGERAVDVSSIFNSAETHVETKKRLPSIRGVQIRKLELCFPQKGSEPQPFLRAQSATLRARPERCLALTGASYRDPASGTWQPLSDARLIREEGGARLLGTLPNAPLSLPLQILF